MAGPELTDFQRGNAALVKGRFEDAIASFLRHASKHPQESADAFAKVAECYKRSNVVVPNSSAAGEEFTLVSEGVRRVSDG